MSEFKRFRGKSILRCYHTMQRLFVNFATDKYANGAYHEF